MASPLTVRDERYDFYAQFLPIIRQHRADIEFLLPSTAERRAEAKVHPQGFNLIPLKEWDHAIGIQFNPNARTQAQDVTLLNPFTFPMIQSWLTEHGMTNSVSNAVALFKATAYFEGQDLSCDQ